MNNLKLDLVEIFILINFFGAKSIFEVLLGFEFTKKMDDLHSRSPCSGSIACHIRGHTVEVFRKRVFPEIGNFVQLRLNDFSIFVSQSLQCSVLLFFIFFCHKISFKNCKKILISYKKNSKFSQKNFVKFLIIQMFGKEINFEFFEV